jgi:hypothetical protein
MSNIEYDFNITGQIEEEIVARYKAVVFEIWNRLSIYTPVLTGKAKANWQTRLNDDTDEVLDRFSKQPMGFQDAGGSQAEVIRVLSALSLKDTVFIVNNVPYIERIERGWPGNPGHPGYATVERAVSDVTTKFNAE